MRASWPPPANRTVATGLMTALPPESVETARDSDCRARGLTMGTERREGAVDEHEDDSWLLLTGEEGLRAFHRHGGERLLAKMVKDENGWDWAECECGDRHQIGHGGGDATSIVKPR